MNQPSSNTCTSKDEFSVPPASISADDATETVVDTELELNAELNGCKNSVLPDLDSKCLAAEVDWKASATSVAVVVDQPNKDVPDDSSIVILDEGLEPIDLYATIVTPLDATHPLPPDGGQGWVIVVASFFVHFSVIGNLYCYSIFQRYLVQAQVYPGATNSSIATVNGVATFIGFLIAPYVGRLADRMGYRNVTWIGGFTMFVGFMTSSLTNQLWQLYLTYGVIVAVGLQLAWIPSVGLPAQWFLKRRGLALGICVSGSGFGGLCLAPAVQAALDAWGWEWAFRLQGLICIVVITISAAFFKERVKRVKPGPEGFLAKVLSFCSLQAFKNMRFSLQFISTFVAFFAYNLPFIFCVPYSSSIGLSPSQGALLLGLMNGASGIGRISLGFVADLFGPVNTLVTSLLVASLSVLAVWSFASSFAVQLVFCLLYGFYGGALLSVTPIVTTSICGTSRAATSLGQIYQSMSVGGLVGPLIGGLLVDSHTTITNDGEKHIDWEPLILYTGFVLLGAAVISVALKFVAGKAILAKV
jgi:MFS family permease